MIFAVVTPGALRGPLPGFVFSRLVFSRLVFSRLVFSRPTRCRNLRITVNRIVAHVLEFRLFIDEPRLIWRAQLAVALDNLRLLRQIALPALLVAIPFVLGYPALDALFGHAALRPGEPVVVTAAMGALSENRTPPKGIRLLSPAVRIARTREVSWTVVPLCAPCGALPAMLAVPYPRRTYFGIPWALWFSAASLLAAAVPGGGRRFVI